MPAPHLLHKRLAATVALAILAACAQRVASGGRYLPPPPYSPPPPSQDSAPVALRATVPPGGLYALDVLGDTQACSGSRRVGTARDGVALRPTALATERWQTLEIDTLDPATHRGCAMRLSFTPRHGRAYLVSAKHENGHCEALVFDNTDPQAPQLESSLRFRNLGTETCAPLARAPAYLRERLREESVSAADLPIDPDADALSSAKAPRTAAPVPKAAEPVSDDDLQGLIKR